MCLTCVIETIEPGKVDLNTVGHGFVIMRRTPPPLPNVNKPTPLPNYGSIVYMGPREHRVRFALGQEKEAICWETSAYGCGPNSNNDNPYPAGFHIFGARGSAIAWGATMGWVRRPDIRGKWVNDYVSGLMLMECDYRGVLAVGSQHFIPRGHDRMMTHLPTVIARFRTLTGITEDGVMPEDWEG